MKDWIECSLGEVCFTTSGGTPSRNNKSFYEGKIPWIKSGELNSNLILDSEEHISEEAIKKSSAKVFPKGTLLFALYGATIGKMATLGIDAATNQAVCGIYESDALVSKYLYNYLFYRKNFLIQQGIGGAQPNISQTILKKLSVPLAPLVEQKAIVKKIEELFSSLDSGIADLKKAQEQLVIYRQAVLKKAFEGELTNSVMRKEELSSLSTKIGDGLHGTPKYDEHGSYFFINGNNLNNGKIHIKPETKKVNEEEYLKYQKDLNDKTVFVSINGTIGNTAFYNNEPVILGKSACYINLKSEMDKKYLRFNFLSSEFINYALKNATGSTIKNVGLKTMRDYLVPLPENKQEQSKIVREIESRLSVCDKVEESLKESLEKAKALRQSILKKAFEGKLLSAEELAKCKADQDYEPASVLLEKIKKEKKKNCFG